MGGCVSVWEVAKLIRGARARVVVVGPSLSLTMMGYLVEAARRGVEVKAITRPIIVRGKAFQTIKTECKNHLRGIV